MNGFLKWFFVFMSSMLAGFGQIFKGLWNGIKQIFNIKNYIRIFKTYSADFGALGWILSVLAIIVVVAIFVLIIFMIVLAVRKYIRFRHSIVSNEDLIEEISDLQRQVVKMTKEKDEIMAMKVAQLGVYDNTALAEGETKLAEGEQMPAQGEVQTTVDGVVQTADCRFSKLIEVDNFYKTYEPPAYNNDITLSGICEAYRNFACSRMHLYYDIKTIRLFIAGMASTQLIILQGISGTGKTSLPYSVGKFLQKDTTIASVQPSWRDRTELFGYFNEFTKNFNETEVLKRIYSSEYNDDVNFILLDEMNIARVDITLQKCFQYSKCLILPSGSLILFLTCGVPTLFALIRASCVFRRTFGISVLPTTTIPRSLFQIRSTTVLSLSILTQRELPLKHLTRRL